MVRSFKQVNFQTETSQATLSVFEVEMTHLMRLLFTFVKVDSYILESFIPKLISQAILCLFFNGHSSAF